MSISIAFSGSGFKFPVHIGALIAAMESGRDIVEVSGTSGGSIVASMWACGMTVPEMLSIALDTDWTSYVKPQLSSILKGAINSGDDVYAFCDDITQGKTFHDLDKKLSVVSLNLATNSSFIFDNATTPTAKVADAIRGSISIPLLFLPHQYQDMHLVDGVATNSLPLDLLNHPTSDKIGVKIINTGKITSKPPTTLGAFQVAKRALYHLIDTQDSWTLESGHFGSIANVHTGYVDGLNPFMSKSMRQRLIDDGYSSMRSILQS